MSRLQTAIICFCILVIGFAGSIFLDLYINRCRGPCGRLGIKTAHERECRAGHNYYSCQPGHVRLKHAKCSPWQDGPEINDE